MAWLCGMHTFFCLLYSSPYTGVLETCLSPPIIFFQARIISGLLSFMTKFILYTHHKAYKKHKQSICLELFFPEDTPLSLWWSREVMLCLISEHRSSHLHCCEVSTFLYLTFSWSLLLEDFFFSISNFNSSLFFRLNCLFPCLMFSIFFPEVTFIL